jgi:hypothetical protein
VADRPLPPLSRERFRAVYDREADVLYLQRGDDPPVASREDAAGILWRETASGGFAGATLTGFRARWLGGRADLAGRLATRFCLKPEEARALVDAAFARIEGAAGPDIDGPDGEGSDGEGSDGEGSGARED